MNTQNNWLDMSSAPKDGSEILVWTHRRHREIARWELDKYATKPRPFWKTTGPWGKNEMREKPPRAWMALPAGPE